MPVFVIGSASSRFEVGSEVIIQPGGEGREVFSNKKYKYGPSFRVKKKGTVISYTAPMKRGVAQEGKGFYARVLPSDAEAGLEELDFRIEAVREVLNNLCRERQEYLAAQVVRGERISEKHATVTT
jgi:hypothetical protein